MISDIVIGLVGCNCRVLSMENDFIFQGLVKDIKNDIVYLKSNFYININEKIKKIKLCIYSEDSEYVLCIGTIKIVDNFNCEVEDVVVLDNRRLYFRVNTNFPAEILIDNIGDMIEDDLDTDNLGDIDFLDNIDMYDININSNDIQVEKVTIKDMSLGGLCFVSTKEFDNNKELVINFNIYEKYFMLSISIKRKIREDGKNKYYGCEYLYLNDEERTYIQKFIAQQDRYNILQDKDLLKK